MPERHSTIYKAAKLIIKGLAQIAPIPTHFPEKSALFLLLLHANLGVLVFPKLSYNFLAIPINYFLFSAIPLDYHKNLLYFNAIALLLKIF